ncbi:MAG: hypothetical protein ABWX60_03020 [Aeromicrobium sp.]
MTHDRLPRGRGGAGALSGAARVASGVLARLPITDGAVATSGTAHRGEHRADRTVLVVWADGTTTGRTPPAPTAA